MEFFLIVFNFFFFSFFSFSFSFSFLFLFFFFNDTATTEIYTLSLHDALPICRCKKDASVSSILSTPIQQFRKKPKLNIELTTLKRRNWWSYAGSNRGPRDCQSRALRSEEHTSELQSRLHLVCRLLLEKKKKTKKQKHKKKQKKTQQHTLTLKNKPLYLTTNELT